MPCHDGGVPYPKSEEELLDDKAPAMLCAIWRTLGQNERMMILKDVDWKRAGVTLGEFVQWWKIHEKADKLREAAELRQAQEKARRQENMALKAKALAKLTAEERTALGLP
jgi:hypothetical protein